MMGSVPYRPFRDGLFRVVFALLIVGTPLRSTAAVEPSLKADLSSVQTEDGSILIATLKIPPEAQKQAMTAKYEDKEVPLIPSPDLGESTYEVLIPVPVDHKPGTDSLEIHVGQQALSVPFTVIAGAYKSEVLHVDPRRVNPKARDMSRIRKEQAEVAEIYGTITPKKYWKGPFVLPIDSPITSPFGTKRVYNGEPRGFHPGVDLRAPIGTPIRADAPGVVVLAKNLFFTGNTVMIDHGYGVITLYAHMSKIKVKKGQEVTAQQLLGLSGKTGRVNGPHLHWQAIIDKVKVNPIELTKVMR